MGLLCLRSRSQGRFEMSVNVCLDNIFWITEHFVSKFGNDEPVMWTFCCCCYLQGRGHSKGSYDQNMTLSTILSELSVSWQPNLVDDTSSEARVSNEKNWITAFRAKVTATGQNLMFVEMIFSEPPNILCSNLELWFIVMSQGVMQKDWFAIFKVKVTARAHMIKIWQFLLYLLNCWSFSY